MGVNDLRAKDLNSGLSQEFRRPDGRETNGRGPWWHSHCYP